MNPVLWYRTWALKRQMNKKCERKMEISILDVKLNNRNHTEVRRVSGMEVASSQGPGEANLLECIRIDGPTQHRYGIIDSVKQRMSKIGSGVQSCSPHATKRENKVSNISTKHKLNLKWTSSPYELHMVVLYCIALY